MFDLNRTELLCAADCRASTLSFGLPPSRRPAHFLAVGLMTLMLLACGGGGGGDSTSGGTGGGGGGGSGGTPLPTVAVTTGTSDTPTLPGSLNSGNTTDDDTPTLLGSLSAPLTTGQQVQVFDGDTLLTPTASVTGMQWQFTPLAPLAQGEHQLSAAVVGADGKVGPRSAVFALTIKETKVVITGAVSDTPTKPGSLSDGSSTDDTTPTLTGSVNITLAAGQKLQVFDGDTPLSPEATVAGSTWQFTPGASLQEGTHRLSAVVLGVDGRAGMRSNVFSLDVLETRVSITSATSDTLTQPGTLTSGSVTDDVTPTLNGVLNVALSPGQQLKVFIGETEMSPAASVSGQQWQFTPTTPLPQGTYLFTAALAGPGGQLGARSPAFQLSLALPGFQGVSPDQILRASPTVLRFAGTNWPNSGITVVPLTDQFDKCTSPFNINSDSFDVTCTFQKMGSTLLDVRLNQQSLSQVRTNVISNVSNLTWASPSTFGFGQGAVRRGELVTFKVTGTQLLQATAFSVQMGSRSTCTASVQEIGTPTETERNFTCTISLIAPLGSEWLSVQANAAGSGEVQVLWGRQALQVMAEPSFKTTSTGITAAQCYKASSDALVSCSSAEALSLSGTGKQDGMRLSSNRMSYGPVGTYSKQECVKDNITGLIWEGKTSTGLRAASNSYTNWGDRRAGDASTYVDSVNASKLCGASDWRLPTANELQSLVDYSKSHPSFLINSEWFPVIRDGYFWTSSLYGENNTAYAVSFTDGSVTVKGQGMGYSVRLVRASP